MKNLLITGFEPFGGEEINPSREAVMRLPSVIGNFSLTKLLIPVVFGEAAEYVIRAAEEISADYVISIGQAGGRDSITPEMVAINLRYSSIPDNKGNQPRDKQIIEGSDTAYFSTLPVRRIADAINSVGISSKVSYSAGTYVCNDVLYSLLHFYHHSNTKVGFIHIPYSKEQNKEPCMDLDDIVKGLSVAIENLEGESE